jgi:hypothetical protein
VLPSGCGCIERGRRAHRRDVARASANPQVTSPGVAAGAVIPRSRPARRFRAPPRVADAPAYTAVMRAHRQVGMQPERRGDGNGHARRRAARHRDCVRDERPTSGPRRAALD